jgi:hypothetical protein
LVSILCSPHVACGERLVAWPLDGLRVKRCSPLTRSDFEMLAHRSGGDRKSESVRRDINSRALSRREAANKYNLIDGVNVCISPHHPHFPTCPKNDIAPSADASRAYHRQVQCRSTGISSVIVSASTSLLQWPTRPPPQYLISLRRSAPPDTILSRPFGGEPSHSVQLPEWWHRPV